MVSTPEMIMRWIENGEYEKVVEFCEELELGESDLEQFLNRAYEKAVESGEIDVYTDDTNHLARIKKEVDKATEVVANELDEDEFIECLCHILITTAAAFCAVRDREAMWILDEQPELEYDYEEYDEERDDDEADCGEDAVWILWGKMEYNEQRED